MAPLFLPMLLRAFFTFLILPEEAFSTSKQAIALPDPGLSCLQAGEQAAKLFREDHLALIRPLPSIVLSCLSPIGLPADLASPRAGCFIWLFNPLPWCFIWLCPICFPIKGTQFLKLISHCWLIDDSEDCLLTPKHRNGQGNDVLDNYKSQCQSTSQITHLRAHQLKCALRCSIQWPPGRGGLSPLSIYCHNIWISKSPWTPTQTWTPRPVIPPSA